MTTKEELIDIINCIIDFTEQIKTTRAIIEKSKFK